MSSRQEEKERRRREREERERAEASRAAGRRRLQLAAGAVIGLVAIAAIIAAIVSATGNRDDSARAAAAAGGYKTVAIPARRISDFDAAVKASGCTFRTYPSEGRVHLPSDTAVFNGYRTNPPTSGNHRPIPASDGLYAPGNSPAKENFVHSLEHGRIEIQYAPDTPALTRDQLFTLYNEKVRGVPAYKELLFENNTNMPYAVAATAWTHLLGCKTMNPQVFDAIRAFRDRFIDKGPEIIPFTG